MKKDIFRLFMALSFVFIAIFSSAYLNSIKEKSREEAKKNQNKNLNKTYESSLESSDFNLPIVIIDTNGKLVSREEKIPVNMQVYDNKEKANKLSNDPNIVTKASIKIRGNSTSKYPKKQYNIELLTNKGKENEKKMLGMAKSSDWVLNGPFADKSLMRNYIALKTSRNIMEYAPDVRFCEVFLIDDNSTEIKEKHYKGVYVMIEKIKRGDKRVDITKSLKNLDETSFILAKDRQKEGDIKLRSYGKETYLYHYGLNVVYPKNSLTPEKYEYIEKHISEFERVLYSDKFNDPVLGYNKYIDVDSFVDYYIINEFFKNTDAGLLSTYIYKDYEEKIKAGPVWDFNKSLGNHNDEIGKPYEHTAFFMNQRPWFDRLMEDVNFANKVVDRYKLLRKTYLSDEYLLNLIDKTVKSLGDASKRNFYQWPMEMSNQAEVFEENGDVSGEYSADINKYKEFLKKNDHLIKDTTGKATSYDEEINLMKNFIAKRGKWMDENIDSLKKWAN